jgi:hypothetical protein
MKSILIKLFIIGLCVSFFPIQAIAEGFTGAGQIEWIYLREVKSDRGLEVRFVEEHANPDGCSNLFVVEVKHNSRRLSSRVNLLRTAMEQGLDVEFFVQNCTEEGQAIVKAIKVFAPEPE